MRPARALTVLAVAVALVAAIAACGGSKEVSATPEEVVGEVPQPTGEELPELPEGDPAAGKSVYNSAGCGGCHTLADAGSTGTVGPSLDESKPDLAKVIDRVLNGAGAMPPFRDQLDDQQVADVSAYVVQAAGG
jgi:mono/diheme cytochrome c family protein